MSQLDENHISDITPGPHDTPVPIFDLQRETIFRPTGRTSMVPYDPKYERIRKNLELQKGSIWFHTKIKFKDQVNWGKMAPDIQECSEKVLGFFAHSDELIEEIIKRSCLSHISIPEIQHVYDFEANMEKEHSLVYNLNIQDVIPDLVKRARLQHAVENMPLVALKADFARRWIGDARSPAYTIVGKAATEGINFSSSFAWIDWLKYQKYQLPGTYLANQEISRDEARHVDTGFLVYEVLDDKLTPDNLAEILDESERIENLFFEDACPRRDLDMMSAQFMREHIRHAKAIVAAGFGHPELYKGTKSPFTFMKKRSLNTKVNFFEEESADYTKLDATEDVAGFDADDAEC